MQECVRGDSYKIKITLVNSKTKAPIDLTGSTIWYTIKNTLKTLIM